METIDRRLRENRTEEERKAQTAAATAARKNLPSTREQAKGNEEQVLRWIGSWGFTSPSILRKLVGAQSLKTIEKNKLISRLETGTTYVPYIYKLTKLGVQITGELYNDDVPNTYVETDSSRIRLDKIRHELTAQHITLEQEIINQRYFITFYTEREYRDLGEIIYMNLNSKNYKIPDVIWFIQTENAEIQRQAIEVELTKKGSADPASSTRYKLDQFIERVIFSLERKDFYEYVIYSRNNGLLADYKAAFGTGQTFGIYDKDRYGKPYQVKKVEIPAHLSKKVLFRKIEDDGRNL